MKIHNSIFALEEDMMDAKVQIFGKGGWPYTEQARSAYGSNASYFDVTSDKASLEKMLRYSGGRRQVPVIVEGEKVTVGYGGSWGVWCLPLAGWDFYKENFYE